MDPSGRFLRAFGAQGSADGKFNYPWGITTDALGFIYVCDKENHRVQVTNHAYLDIKTIYIKQVPHLTLTFENVKQIKELPVITM